MELDGEDLEQVEHFPSQEDDRDYNYEDGKGFSKVQAVAGRFKTPGHESENIEGGESKNQYPENAVNVALPACILERHR